MHKKLVFLSVLTLVLAGTTQAKIVGWWKFDDGAGTVAIDSSGSGNNGALINGPTWVAGQFNGAVKLDGTDDYIDLPVDGLMATLTDSTFTAWVNWTGGGVWQRVFDFGRNATYNMFLTPTNAGSAIRFAITIGGSGAEEQCTGTARLPAGWHHVAVTIDMTKKVDTLWLDGAMIVQNFSATLSPKDVAPTNCWLGRSQYADPYLNGALDEFRIYDVALTQDNVQAVMGGAGATFEAATKPIPALNATDTTREPVLGWKPGPTGKTHDVYFGTSFADVNTATRAKPLGVLISQGQDANSLDLPGRLAFGTTYYWRIDEIDASGGAFKGEMWNFTTEPLAYTVTNITATASSSANATAVPQNTVNGSGMTGDLHDTNTKSMWLSGSVQPAWIKYDLGSIYKLYEMWVWNHNSSFELLLNFGIKNATIEYSTDGTNWSKLGDFEFAQAPGEDDYAHNTTVPFAGVAAQFVRITSNGTWGDTPGGGLSAVRFFNIPVQAREPQPATGTTGVDPTTVAFSWRAGREAALHKIYIGTDSNAVKASTTPTGTSNTASFAPSGLQLSTTYYWRVDEVNTAEAITTWPSPIWSFSTPDFVTVDDFEAYNDNEGTRIFDVWVDGYGTTDNGSQVGYLQSPFAERTTRHGGRQSMPLAYNNSGSIAKSEATRTFSVTQDWTAAGIKTLVVFFHGLSTNSAGQLYVKINGTRVDYAGSTAGLSAPLWKQWNINLASVSGGVKAVKSLTIGVTGTGSGTLYIDDILLYAVAPAVPQPTDPGTANLAAYFPFEGDAKDSKGVYNGTLNNVTFVTSMNGFGKAAQFNGTTAYIDLGTSFGSGLIGSLTNSTFAAWVNYTGTGAIWQRVFDFGTGTTAYAYMTTRNASSMPRFAITTASTAGESGATSSQVMSVGWHHLAGVLDASAMTIRLYVDGTAVQTNPTTKLPKDLASTTQNWLGRSEWAADPYLNGALDDFRIYNRALTEGEVRYLVGDR